MDPLELDKAVRIAEVCHQANNVLRAQLGEELNPDWWDASEEMRRSAVEGVCGVLEGNTPEQSHESWCAFKIRHGWVYGEMKSEEFKTHPCLVPYADLPEAQKQKDALFVGIVNALKG